MKNIYIFILCSVFATSGQSQNTWGPPFPLTDSLTDNVNATLSILPDEIFHPIFSQLLSMPETWQPWAVLSLWRDRPMPISNIHGSTGGALAIPCFISAMKQT